MDNDSLKREQFFAFFSFSSASVEFLSNFTFIFSNLKKAIFGYNFLTFFGLRYDFKQIFELLPIFSIPR